MDLSSVYYNPAEPAGFSGINSLYQSVKGQHSRKSVKEWLQSQDTYTLHKPVRKVFPRNKYVVYSINELWQADLNDMRGIAKYNEGYNYILTVIDVFSKKAYARALKNKTANHVKAAFSSIFSKSGNKPHALQTDKGTEFTAREIRDFFKDNGITYFTTKNPDVKASVVERFNRTLKTKMWRYLTFKNTYTYIDVLDSLVDAYNNSVHRSIKCKPNDVKKSNSFQVWMNLYGGPQKRKSVKPKLKPGDHVRISKAKGTFEKGYETNWSEEIFVINRVLPYHPQPLYTLTDLKGESIDGMFYEYEVQKVIIQPHKTYKVDKILKTRGRDASKEYLVKWRGYSEEFNSWIPASDLQAI